MLKRTAAPFYGDRQSRMHRHADAVARAPLAFGETMQQRQELAARIRSDADADRKGRVDAWEARGRRKAHKGPRGLATGEPSGTAGKAYRKRQRVACAAAVKRAHDPSLREPTGKQKRAAAKAARRPESGT